MTEDGTDPVPVRLVMVGSELLEGTVADRNLSELSRAVTERGGRVTGAVVVRDEPEAIRDAVSESLAGAAGTVMCGGLGPTADDRTRDAVAEALDAQLITKESWVRRLRERDAEDRYTEESLHRQARVPRGSRLLENPVGTASGFGWDEAPGWLLALPGVPAELGAMLGGGAGEWLDERLPGKARERVRVGIVGMSESRVAREAEAVAEREGVELASYPRYGVVDLHLAPPGRGRRDAGDGGRSAGEAGPGSGGRLTRAEAALREVFGDAVYEVGERSLAEVVLDLLRSRGETVAVAESCTGGLLGAELTSVPGSSDVFWGGVIAYADEAKRELLGVPAATLEEDGAVSEATVRAMARGIRQRSGTDWGAAITGIAGPEGGTEAKPVGTVWVAADGPGCVCRRHRLPGGRSEVRIRSVHAALDVVRRLALREEA